MDENKLQEGQDKSLAGSKIQAVPKDKVEIGIDTDKQLAKSLINASQQSLVDISALDDFLNVSQSRDQVYSLIDTMSQDATIAAIIETYVEDICEPNQSGDIVWVESTEPEISAYVSYLLESLKVNQNIVGWTTKLVKYGDCYLRLYRRSDYDNDPVFGANLQKQEELDNRTSRALHEGLIPEEVLNEDIYVSYHADNDHYVHYVEDESNPATMYELTKFGKTIGYVKADINPVAPSNMNTTDALNALNYALKTKKEDVTIYLPTDFIHLCADDNSSRTPEEVEIFLNDDDYQTETNGNVYKVKRGQSLLYNSFKVWRLLALLENSVALNRITRTSILRILQVEVGNMSEQGVEETLNNVKAMVEQKTSIKQGTGLNEYTNPGPVENTIYMATNNGIGAVTTQELGSTDSDPKSLLDLDYYNNKLFGSFRVPKQFFAQTDDGAGFNGGESLTIISSRYGKAIKKYQNYVCQSLTNLINLFLLDKGLDSYINKFTIKMQAPVTREEIERKEQSNNEIGMIRDLMDTISTYIEDDEAKLEALKILLSNSSQDNDLIQLIDEEINRLAKQINEEPAEEESEEEEESSLETSPGERNTLPRIDLDNLESEESEEETTEEEPTEEEEGELPTFAELGIEDATDLGVQ